MTLGGPAERVLATIEMAQEGRFGEVRDLFVEQLRPMVSVEALRAAWDAEMTRLGTICSIGAAVTEPRSQEMPGSQGMVVVKVPVTCARGSMAVVASFNAIGQLTGPQLLPPSAAEPTVPWEPPDYVGTEKFDEQEVMVGSGPLAVPGTLSIPKMPRPCPAVVLLLGRDRMTGTRPSAATSL